jgi:heme/copper-type cytochrome/quinol oxidase subunit 2
MLKNIKSAILSLSALILISFPAVLPVTASAQDFNQQDINNSLCSGSNGDISGNSTNCDSGASAESVNQKIANIINILSVIVGIVAVVMIIIGGLRYITSGGASEKVSGAKNTILYALIGLIIVALAQVIVHFVINRVAP